jgi:myo-inositol 2-dehydrogenase/D-chiro-inositol 1-dehydrogenase
MRFALLGDHVDGLMFARALAESGRHELRLYSGSPAGLDYLQRHGMTPAALVDLEALLADPSMDAVIVAGTLHSRRVQLRRALQSECHVLCVHPADAGPDTAYEAAMIHADTGRVLLPLMPMALHPGVARLRSLALKPFTPRLLEMEIWSAEEALLNAEEIHGKPGLPGWDVLRAIGGEISELFALSTGAELAAREPIQVSARFLSGVLIQATYLPRQADARLRLALVLPTGRATLDFPHGWPGAAQLTFIDEQGESRCESWDAHSPWEALLARFEQAVEGAAIKKPQPGQPCADNLTQTPPLLGWQDELRALELDDAARRSIERGRTSTLDLQEATEEASFKGTMTLVGCSLIWLAVVGLIASYWLPWLLWVILPLFVIFIVMQSLRWVLPQKEMAAAEKRSGTVKSNADLRA